MQNLLLIVNPAAGKVRIKTELFNVIKVFSDEDYSVHVYITRRRHDATAYVEKNGASYDVIVACGGDGTFHEVVTGALKIRYQGKIGFIPTGTTNDYAAGIGIPKRIGAAAAMIARLEAVPMDFGVINRGRYFTYIAAFGAFTNVTYTTDQNLKNLFGHVAYIGEAISSLPELREYRMTVDCDGEIFEGEFLFGAVTNTLSIGGVMKLKKETVSLNDGFFEVVLIRNPKNAQDLANLSKEMLSGNFENKSVLLLRGKKIRFQCKEEIPWCLDGEFAGYYDDVTARNLHAGLNVVCPSLLSEKDKKLHPLR